MTEVFQAIQVGQRTDQALVTLDSIVPEDYSSVTACLRPARMSLAQNLTATPLGLFSRLPVSSYAETYQKAILNAIVVQAMEHVRESRGCSCPWAFDSVATKTAVVDHAPVIVLVETHQQVNDGLEKTRHSACVPTIAATIWPPSLESQIGASDPCAVAA